MLRLIIFVVISMILFNQTQSYSALNDERIIRAHLDRLQKRSEPPKDHTKVARNLVYKAKWASAGTISTDPAISGFPMVNIISISDGIKDGRSTGIIYFLSTTLDFTGKDLLVHNKTTFMITDDEDMHCSKQKIDPMEPTCARVHISGSVIKMNTSLSDYEIGFNSIIKLHPAAENWIKAHTFSLCKVNIENIYVLDFYGGPHQITAEQYYAASPDYDNTAADSKELSDESVNELRNTLDYYSQKNEINIKIEKNKYRKVNIVL